MLVECIGTKGDHLPSALLDSEGYGTAETDFGTTIGEQYIVFAMSVVPPGSVSYCLDSGHLYDVPAELFNLIDGRVSRHWIYNHERWDSAGGQTQSAYFWGYPEFTSSNTHRLHLYEGQRDAVELFESYRRQMDLEFALASVAGTANWIDDGWVMCSACCDAWQPLNLLDEMGKCPSCGAIHRILPKSHS